MHDPLAGRHHHGLRFPAARIDDLQAAEDRAWARRQGASRDGPGLHPRPDGVRFAWAGPAPILERQHFPGGDARIPRVQDPAVLIEDLDDDVAGGGLTR